MRLVVDTNRIIAALVRDGVSRKIITHFDGELITIGFSIGELGDHKEEILKKAKISETDLEMILNKLFSKMTILEDKIIVLYMGEATDIMEDIDPADTPFIAAALATKAPIWSDDKHFKKQNQIEILNTKELVEMLRHKL
ncbi:MAG: PIN domain-containing protein [Candidatus Micrarchaeota archaeon]